jgi:xylan 1,4-beta-xylosidase
MNNLNAGDGALVTEAQARPDYFASPRINTSAALMDSLNSCFVPPMARWTLFVCCVLLLMNPSLRGQGTAKDAEMRSNDVAKILVDAREAGSPFPHFWEGMFGSGQAVLALRDSYRKDLRMVKDVTDFSYIRFHDILGDQVGVFNIDKEGKPYYNFSYVDQIYDGLLSDGVRPFVELSFTPDQLGSADRPRSVWYKPNDSPPKDYAMWDDMIRHFARHLVERYGIDEVSQWYFEVWNEPDYSFGIASSKQNIYFTLYDHTAADLKNVDARLRVGGPATANSNWIPEFLNHCKEGRISVDFVSTHMYGDEAAEVVFHTKEDVPRSRMVCKAVEKVHKEVEASPFPHLPLILSEFNASWRTEPDVTDSVYMGPWLAETIRQCNGMVDMMSYWTFSDVFEEEGVVKKPFYGGYGLVAVDDIPKPAFNAFALLHKLGDTRLRPDLDSALVTRRKDGTLVIALWNYAAPPRDKGPAGGTKTFELELKGTPGRLTARISRVDSDHGNVLKTFNAIGQPAFPTKAQIEQLQAAATLPPTEAIGVTNGQLSVAVPSQGLVLLEIL